MNYTLTGLKISNKYVPYAGWLVVLYAVVISYLRFLNHGLVENTDEAYYCKEAEYCLHYGFYQSLAQGTSFIYSLLICLFSKIFSLNILSSVHFINLPFYFISCFLLLKCFDLFDNLGKIGKYFGLLFYVAIVQYLLFQGLPDIICTTFFLGTFNLILRQKSTLHLIGAGVLLFLGFAVKPVILFTIPGILLYLLLRNRQINGLGRNAMNSIVFLSSFIICFSIYHLPGYMAYGKLMLEDKGHDYNGSSRVEHSTSWQELNIYYEVYNVNHKNNKWAVTWEEVSTFKTNHPEIDLKLSYIGYAKTYPKIWAGNIAKKATFGLANCIQYGFFFAKWTFVNKYIKSVKAIFILTFLLMCILFVLERKFISNNIIILIVPFAYYLALSMYTIPQLEGNWLLCCLPFIALPVAKFLCRYIDIYLLLTLQLLFLTIPR